MGTAWESPIMRVTTGKLNTVNDTVIGGVEKIEGSGIPRYGGMLGKHLWVSPDNIDAMFDPTVGDLFGGRYRYVRLRAADSAAPPVGQCVFWDISLTDWQKQYQVTGVNDLTPNTASSVLTAGVYLGGIGLGNFGFIQDLGMADVLAASAFTDTAAIGSRMYLDTAEDGLMESIDQIVSAATDILTLSLKQYLGIAVELPVVDTVTQVLLGFDNALAVT